MFHPKPRVIIPYGLTHPEVTLRDSSLLGVKTYFCAIFYPSPFVKVSSTVDDRRPPSPSWPSDVASLTSFAGPAYTPCPTPYWQPRPPTSKATILNICKRYSPQCCCPLCNAERIARLEEEERKSGTPVQQEIDDSAMENVCDFLFKDEDDDYTVVNESDDDDGVTTPAQMFKSPRTSTRRLSTGSDMSMSSTDSIFAHHERTSSDTTLSSIASFASESDASAAEAASTPKPDGL